MEKVNKFCKDKFYTMYFLIGIISVILWVVLMWGESIWFDEAYSFGMIRRTYRDIYKIAAADVHPPLYYTFLKLITSPFSNKLLAGKIFSIVPFIIIIMLGGYQLKKLFNEKIALLFMVVFVTHPYMLSWSIEVRMYSIAAMFVFVNAIYAYKCWFIGHKSDWMIFTLAGVCAAYTHYFALVAVVFVYILLLISILLTRKKDIKYWTACVVGSIILFSPWLGAFLGQLSDKVNNEYWISSITITSLKGYFIKIFGANGFPKYKFIISSVYVLLFVRILALKNKNHTILAIMSISIPALTIIAGVVVSIVIRPVFVIRYVVPALPVLFVFVALGLDSVKSKGVSAILFFIIMSGFVTNYISQFKNEYFITNNEINENFIQEVGDFDCAYTEMESNEQMFSCILALYSPDKIIYRTEPFNQALLPFENLEMNDNFNENNNNKVLVIVTKNASIPYKLKNTYEFEYKTTVNTQDTDADVYMLTHK